MTMRRASSRRSTASRRRPAGSRRRGRNALGQFTGRAARRSRVSGYTRNGVRVSSYLREEDMLLNPIGGAGFMDNPISGGEIATVFVTAGAGWIVTDMISRYLETYPVGTAAPTGKVFPDGTSTASATSNATAILGMPSWTNILVQLGISVAGLGLGGYLGRGGQGGYGTAALNGLGVGAGLHLIGQLASALLARLAGSKTAANGSTPTGFLSRLYAPEIQVQYVQYATQTAAAAANPAATVTPGFAGLPGRLGDYVVNPANPYGVATQQLANGQYAAVFNPGNPYGQPSLVQLPNGPWAAAVNPGNAYGAPSTQPQQLLTSPVAIQPAAVMTPVTPAAPSLSTPVTQSGSGSTPVTQSGSGSTTGWNGDNGNDSSDSNCGCMGFTPYSTFPD
jgi:hypothetical protein